MSRLMFAFVFAFSVSVFSFSMVGCGPSGNTVNEDTRTTQEIDQEEEDYEKQMEEDADEVTE